MAIEPVVVQSIEDDRLIATELRDAAALEQVAAVAAKNAGVFDREASANERCAAAFERQSASAQLLAAQHNPRREELAQLVTVIAGQRLATATTWSAAKCMQIVTEARALQAEMDKQSTTGGPLPVG